jgi:hypothetical protein
VPGVPTGFSISDSGNPQRPTIDWGDVPEATFYNVWLVNMGTGALAESAVGISGSEFTPSADLAVAPHRIFVRAGNVEGLGAWSAPFDFTVQAASGFTISETGGATEVSENSDPTLPHPETDTFTVVLAEQPDPGTSVVLDVSSSDTGEATVSPGQLTFDSANWDQPQTVTVSGINDNLADGNQTVTVTVAVNDALTTDDAFDALADRTVSVAVLDVPVTPEVLGPLTGETVPNGQVTFTWNDVAGATSYNIWLLDLANPAVVLYFNLDVPPGGTFTLPAADALAGPGNYRYFFSANNANGFSDWSGPHDFAVQASSSVPAAPTGFTILDSGNPLRPTIDWDDVPGATFYNVWLVNLDTGALAESATGIATSSFTPSADLAEARHRIFVRAGNVVGLGNWSAPFDFEVTAEPVGFTISETGGTTEVSENSDPTLPHPETDTFTVVLDNPPDAGTVVVLDVASSDTGEATVSPAQLTFDSSNWDQPQTVTVSGFNDNLDDGNQTATVTVAVNPALTTDDRFDTLADQTVSVTILNVPVTPQMLGPVANETVDDGQVTFTWIDVAGASSYNIWLLDLANPSVVLYFKFDIPPGGTFTLPAADALAPGHYRYFFSANNDNGFSAWSGPHDFFVAEAENSGSAALLMDSGLTDDVFAKQSWLDV